MSDQIIHSLTKLLTTLSSDAHTRGKQFERISKWWLENTPVNPFAEHTIEQVWLWDEWPDRPGPDTGIDLVAKLSDGSLCAIQAKCIDEGLAIPKSQLDSFISSASTRIYAHRLLISTTDGLSANARRMLQEQHVIRVMRTELETSLLAWPASIEKITEPIVQPKWGPRPHQQEAINNVIEGFKKHDRGQLIMACGTGKTLTALWITEKLAPDTTLVLVPSLSLLSQTLSEWAQHTKTAWTYICVCSDDTVNKSNDEPISTVDDFPFEVTTNPERIATFLSISGRKVIFSTYQSSAQIATALTTSHTPIDLAICDEAHRLTGKTAADYATILDNNKILATKRLFMTATPRTYTASVKKKAEERGVDITSMDDERTYGPVLHTLTFGQAIEQELLSDYRVVIVGVTDPQVQELIDKRELLSIDGDIETDARTLAAHIGLAKATKDFNLQRTISFHSRINSAAKFAKDHTKILKWLPESHTPTGTSWTGTISGAMNTGERRQLLNQLREDEPGRHALLTNARCLTEGIDVPTLDGVAFIDPRASQVDIIQAVGRAIRKSTSKSIGVIVLPVLMSEGNGLPSDFEETAFRPIWAVLNALKAHSSDLELKLSQMRTELGRSTNVTSFPDQIQIDLPAQVEVDWPNFVEGLKVSIIEHTTQKWEWWYGQLLSHIELNGTSRVKEGTVFRGFHLDRWVQAQRSAHNAGRLPADRTEALEMLPDWTWDPFEDFWEEHFRLLNNITITTGTSNIPKRLDIKGRQLGQWCQNQRTRYRSGKLSSDRIARLESLAGWTWNVLEDNWTNAFTLLGKYLSQSGGQYPTSTEVFQDFQLGAWVARQRSQRATHWMTNERRTQLEGLPGWTWQLQLQQQSAGLDDFIEYIHSGGVPSPSPGTVYNSRRIDLWVSVQRRSYKRGTLSEDVVEKLEKLPGWSWDPMEQLWNENFQLLKAESLRRGTSVIPIREVVNGVKLGAWCQAQRQNFAKGRLSKDRIDLLSTLPQWTFKLFEDRWDYMFGLLVQFSSERGHARPEWKEVFGGENLGSWVFNQTRKFKSGNLDSEQIEKLGALPGWTWDRMNSEWDQTFELVKEFARRNGHVTLSEDFEVDGKNLQSWIHNQKQRRRQGRLEQERASRLEELPGWSWDVHGDRWDRSFEVVAEFLLNGGPIPSSKTIKVNGVTIATWIRTQRRKFREGNLSQDQIAKLQDLPGWTWNHLEDSWNEEFVLLEGYVEMFGTSRVPDTYVHDGFALGKWVARQRKQFKSGALEPAQQSALESLPGWSWDPYMDMWMKMYNALLDYSNRSGGALPPASLVHEGLSIGMWASRQRSKFKRGQLEQWQIDKLNLLPEWTWPAVRGNTST